MFLDVSIADGTSAQVSDRRYSLGLLPPSLFSVSYRVLIVGLSAHVGVVMFYLC